MANIVLVAKRLPWDVDPAQILITTGSQQGLDLVAKILIDADSRVLLREVGRLVGEAGYRIVHVDSTIVAQAPKMAPHIASMVANIAADLGIEQGRVNVKAKTTERLGFVGREEGMAADAIASIEKIQ